LLPYADIAHYFRHAIFSIVFHYFFHCFHRGFLHFHLFSDAISDISHFNSWPLMIYFSSPFIAIFIHFHFHYYDFHYFSFRLLFAIFRLSAIFSPIRYFFAFAIIRRFRHASSLSALSLLIIFITIYASAMLSPFTFSSPSFSYAISNRTANFASSSDY